MPAAFGLDSTFHSLMHGNIRQQAFAEQHSNADCRARDQAPSTPHHSAPAGQPPSHGSTSHLCLQQQLATSVRCQLVRNGLHNRNNVIAWRHGPGDAHPQKKGHTHSQLISDACLCNTADPSWHPQQCCPLFGAVFHCKKALTLLSKGS